MRRGREPASVQPQAGDDPASGNWQAKDCGRLATFRAGRRTRTAVWSCPAFVATQSCERCFIFEGEGRDPQNASFGTGRARRLRAAKCDGLSRCCRGTVCPQRLERRQPKYGFHRRGHRRRCWLWWMGLGRRLGARLRSRCVYHDSGSPERPRGCLQLLRPSKIRQAARHALGPASRDHGLVEPSRPPAPADPANGGRHTVAGEVRKHAITGDSCLPAEAAPQDAAADQTPKCSGHICQFGPASTSVNSDRLCDSGSHGKARSSILTWRMRP
jgi:hypothetical protein